MNKKVALISLGCPKNLIDSEIMTGILSDAGYTFTDTLASADIVIINTCTFIEPATCESISKIIEISKEKREGMTIIAAGCMAQRYKGDILKELPEVDHVIGTGQIDDILDVLGAPVKGIYTEKVGSDACFSMMRMPSSRSGYGFLRIAEGCDKRCTYCVIPSLRGKYRSRKLPEIISEARILLDLGYKELVLIAEDTTYYGKEAPGQPDLCRLLHELDSLEGDFCIRLLYCYPENIDDELIAAVKNTKKVVKYIDMPIQHISDRILKAMNRRTGSAYIKETIDKIRKEIDGITIRTTLITGFPGETDEDVDMLRQFLEGYRLDHVGIFPYSREEGTPAYRLKKQVPEALKDQRARMLSDVQKGIVKCLNESRIGRIYTASIDGVSEDGLFYKGRISSQAPEIDPCTYILGLKDLNIGDKVDIKIIAVDEYDLIGEIIHEPSE